MTVGRSRHLGAAEELELIRLAQAGDQAALTRLVVAHQNLVAKMARTLASAMRVSDGQSQLESAGMEGLIKAVQKYSFDRAEGQGRDGKHIRLNTYAKWWIRQMITDYMVENRSIVTPPNHAEVRRAMAHLSKFKDGLFRGDGHLNMGRVSEMAAALGIREDHALEAIRASFGDFSVDAPANDDGEPFIDSLRDPIDVEAEIMEERSNRKLLGIVQQAMRSLRPRDRMILIARTTGGQTLEQVAQKLGVSRERVRQLETKALRRTRAMAKAIARGYGHRKSTEAMVA